jgi:hypothetical protein
MNVYIYFVSGFAHRLVDAALACHWALGAFLRFMKDIVVWFAHQFQAASLMTLLPSGFLPAWLAQALGFIITVA